jgi:lipopolysaccharide export system permease protein
MYYQVAFVPGGQAIGALESVYAKRVKWIRTLLRRRDRDPSNEEAAAGAV